MCLLGCPVPSVMLKSITSGASRVPFRVRGLSLGSGLAGVGAGQADGSSPPLFPIPSVGSAQAEAVSTWAALCTGDSGSDAAGGDECLVHRGHCRPSTTTHWSSCSLQVVLRCPAVGDCDPGGQPLPWDSSRAALQPSEDRLPDGEARQLQRGDVSRLCSGPAFLRHRHTGLWRA